MYTSPHAWFVVLLLFCTIPLSASINTLFFTENLNQWEKPVRFAADVQGGRLFLENDRFTYLIKEPIPHKHGSCHQHEEHCEAPHAEGDEGRFVPRAHAYQMVFEGASKSCRPVGTGKLSRYNNYFLGNDPARWASEVPCFSSVLYEEIYDCVDVQVYSKDQLLKYDLYLNKGADPEKIRLRYPGAEELHLSGGRLLVETSLGTVIESRPYAYQLIDGRQCEVDCDYRLRDGLVSFSLGAYDPEYELVIDPTIIFATYSGSAADNWGSTATYDDEGFGYVGGVVFNTGYPVTTGAIQNYFAGGYTDSGITKFTPDGSSVVYATYIGGSDAEFPHSLVTDDQGNLVVFGTSGSNNYPVSANAYSSSHSGGSSVDINGVYFSKSDIVISKFSSSGNQLLGSTYLGGSENDGINYYSWQMVQNYGDEARGEVIIDGSNIVVVSCTQSSNFPTTAAAVQTSYSGNQDGIAASFNTDLSALNWSTFVGSANADAAYSIKLNSSNGYYYLAGGSMGDMGITGGAITAPMSLGSNPDGFLLKLSSDGSQFTGTYLGTSDYDQAFFVEIDEDGRVYAYGQSKGNYPVQGEVWSQAGQKMFVHCFASDLLMTEFSTTFGVNGQVSISPTAFLVDKCGRVYMAGWGGYLNNYFNSGPAGMFVTPDAYLSTSDNGNFYFLILSRDAEEVLYATFFGGSTTSEHVDGGTSRFDSNGVIYQAICACGTSTPTTSGVPYPSSGSFGCNAYLVKLDMEQSIPKAIAAASPAQSGCADPVFTVQFENTSVGAETYVWDFGNGFVFEGEDPPPVIYSEAGTYDVQMIATSAQPCVAYDTLDVQIFVGVPEALTATISYQSPAECTSLEYTFATVLEAENDPALDYSYYWDFGDGYTSAEANPTHSFPSGGSYTVSLTVTSLIDNYCDSMSSDQITLDLTQGLNVSAAFVDPGSGCVPYQLNSSATMGNNSYTWTLDGQVISNEAALNYELMTAGDFLLELIVSNPASCNLADTASLTVSAYAVPEVVDVPVELCEGGSYQLPNTQVVSEAGDYQVSYLNANNCDSLVNYVLSINQNFEQNVSVEICEGSNYALPDGGVVVDAGTYTTILQATNNCDSVIYTTISYTLLSESYQTVSICEGQSFTLPDGGVVTDAGTYSSTLQSADGCDSLVYTTIDFTEVVQGSELVSICEGSSYQLPSGEVVSQAGNYVSSLFSNEGCDSIVNTSLTFLPISNYEEDLEICPDSAAILADGSTISEAGEYNFTFTGVNGCDSLVKQNIVLLSEYQSTFEDSFCQEENYVLPTGVEVDSPGQYEVSFTAENGCDSLVLYELSLLPVFVEEFRETVCDGAVYTLADGSEVAETDIYEVMLISELGCDSLIVYDLLFEPISNLTLEVQVCEGDNYQLPDGSLTSESGMYEFTLLSELGCDSLINVNIEMLDVLQTEQELQLCEGQDLQLPDGSFTSEAGQFEYNYQSGNGCDSISTVIVEIIESYEGSESFTLCPGSSLMLPNGEQVIEEGSYMDLLFGVSGCDSLMTYEVVLLATFEQTVEASICEDQEYLLPDGSTVSLAGIYESVFEASNGCDSLILTNLSTIPTYDLEFPVQLCEGQSYSLADGSLVEQPGQYEQNLESIFACDSVVTVVLTIVEDVLVDESYSICEGDSFNLIDGSTVSEEGSYVTNLPGAEGCDSIVTQYISVLPLTLDTQVVEICDGEQVLLPDGSSVQNGGLYETILQSVEACDSIIVTDLRVQSTYYSLQEERLCIGDSFELPNGEILQTDTSLQLLFSTAEFCDSVVAFNLSFSGNYVELLEELACVGEVITMPDGSFVDSPGQYDFHFETVAGCDSSLLVMAAFENCDQFIIMPNAFSPNADGMNDLLTVMTNFEVENFYLSIFDRWGKQLFESRQIEQGWDGSYKGETCELGVYVFYYTLSYNDNGILKEFEGKGNVTLLR